MGAPRKASRPARSHPVAVRQHVHHQRQKPSPTSCESLQNDPSSKRKWTRRFLITPIQLKRCCRTRKRPVTEETFSHSSETLLVLEGSEAGVCHQHTEHRHPGCNSAALRLSRSRTRRRKDSATILSGHNGARLPLTQGPNPRTASTFEHSLHDAPAGIIPRGPPGPWVWLTGGAPFYRSVAGEQGGLRLALCAPALAWNPTTRNLENQEWTLTPVCLSPMIRD